MIPKSYFDERANPVRISRSRGKGFVYFIQAGDYGLVKVGWSLKPDSRMATLQMSSAARLKLLLAVPGSNVLEAEIHRQFSDHRQHGEWFTPTPELLAAIKSWRKVPPDPKWSPQRTYSVSEPLSEDGLDACADALR